MSTRRAVQLVVASAQRFNSIAVSRKIVVVLNPELTCDFKSVCPSGSDMAFDRPTCPQVKTAQPKTENAQNLLPAASRVVDKMGYLLMAEGSTWHRSKLTMRLLKGTKKRTKTPTQLSCHGESDPVKHL
jgi:hypothetical protein